MFAKQKFYTASFLPNDDEARAKQGLMSQNLASNCFSSVPNFSNGFYCNNCVGYTPRLSGMYRKNAFEIAKDSTNDKLRMPLINTNNLLYPIYNPPINYGSLPPSNTNPCTRYVQGP